MFELVVDLDTFIAGPVWEDYDPGENSTLCVKETARKRFLQDSAIFTRPQINPDHIKDLFYCIYKSDSPNVNFTHISRKVREFLERNPHMSECDIIVRV